MAVKVKCPACGKAVEWNEKNTFRPFCSERCKSIDLGACWAAEQYRVAGSPVDSAEELPPSERPDKPQH